VKLGRAHKLLSAVIGDILRGRKPVQSAQHDADNEKTENANANAIRSS